MFVIKREERDATPGSAPGMMSATADSYGRKIATALVFAIFGLAVFELGALFFWGESAAERNSFGYSRDAGFEIRDGQVKIGRAPSRSLLSQRYPVVKPADVRRIVVVGDSILRGHDLASSVSGQLKAALAQCGIASEVWNLSSPGYGSLRKDVIVRKSLEFNPDLILYHATFTTEYEDAREWERMTEYASWHPRHWLDKLPFMGRLRLSVLERLLWSWQPQPESRDSGTAEDLAARLAAIRSKLDAAYWIPRMMKNLQATVEETRSHGVPMIVLSRADLDGPRITDYGLDAALRPLAAEPNIRLVSTLQVMSHARDPARLYSDGSHWTEEGHRVMAEAMVGPAFALMRISTPPSCPAGRSGTDIDAPRDGHSVQ